MLRKEVLQLFSSAKNNKVEEVSSLLALKDSFDINWKNASLVSNK